MAAGDAGEEGLARAGLAQLPGPPDGRDPIPRSAGMGQVDPLPSSQQRFWLQMILLKLKEPFAIKSSGPTDRSLGGHQPCHLWYSPIALSLRLLIFKQECQDFLVVLWIRTRLPVQGTQFRFLIWEDCTGRRAPRPV